LVIDEGLYLLAYGLEGALLLGFAPLNGRQCGDVERAESISRLAPLIRLIDFTIFK
jgi:hypothetical protein